MADNKGNPWKAPGRPQREKKAPVRSNPPKTTKAPKYTPPIKKK